MIKYLEIIYKKIQEKTFYYCLFYPQALGMKLKFINIKQC